MFFCFGILVLVPGRKHGHLQWDLEISELYDLSWFYFYFGFLCSSGCPGPDGPQTHRDLCPLPSTEISPMLPLPAHFSWSYHDVLCSKTSQWPPCFKAPTCSHPQIYYNIGVKCWGWGLHVLTFPRVCGIGASLLLFQVLPASLPATRGSQLWPQPKEKVSQPSLQCLPWTPSWVTVHLTPIIGVPLQERFIGAIFPRTWIQPCPFTGLWILVSAVFIDNW